MGINAIRTILDPILASDPISAETQQEHGVHPRVRCGRSVEENRVDAVYRQGKRDDCGSGRGNLGFFGGM